MAGQVRGRTTAAATEHPATRIPVVSATTTTFRAARRAVGPRACAARLRHTLDRPLTAYYLILGSSLLILVLGLVMVFSASQITALRQGLPVLFYFGKQLIAVLLGCGLLFVAARLPIAAHRALAYPLLLGSVFLLVLVTIPGIGVEVGGNRNWIGVGLFQIQPSEFGKLALVLWGADLLARKHRTRTLDQWKHLLVPLVPGAVFLLMLIMAGGDMGTAMILVAILFGQLWMAGAPLRLFAGAAGIAVMMSTALIVLAPHRLARISCVGVTRTGPDEPCWQAVHGLYALASGGLFGSGLGAGVEKWGQLPASHTDFIFAVTGEELGLAGTLSVLALFAALGYAGIRVAGRTKDPFVRYAAGGATTWITAQSVINIGAVLGLLPIAGVPLPLFSYGGSALLPTLFAIGMLLCFARSEPGARAALAARGSTSRIRATLARVLPRRTTARPATQQPRRER